ncbi:hypothetical protein PFTANZ_05887 [Plasmodium falciparum Tanzania (2000708)]|uniref:Uncharacterized protein n=2 Tax=Plasmodium falciparum TaxID=5833 RepID=A0A024VZU6_PLAFA|nr:hypothetical protein PFFVO_03057 [Plasmodium falciparum Vietnam Oak-Knoll (FVO)]ETW33396.1 hypothetical protein PFTANZ_05887 [Plasmodium falciparum Tanzania (2000708)]
MHIFIINNIFLTIFGIVHNNKYYNFPEKSQKKKIRAYKKKKKNKNNSNNFTNDESYYDFIFVVPYLVKSFFLKRYPII